LFPKDAKHDQGTPRGVKRFGQAHQLRRSVLEHLGHQEWGILAPPKNFVRWLGLASMGLIIGGILGSGLVISMITSEREELRTLSSTTITQPTEAAPTAPLPPTSAGSFNDPRTTSITHQRL